MRKNAVRGYTVYYDLTGSVNSRDQSCSKQAAELKSKMATEVEYESVLCVKPDVNVYRIPPRASNRAVR